MRSPGDDPLKRAGTAEIPAESPYQYQFWENSFLSTQFMIRRWDIKGGPKQPAG